jgi:transposase
VEIDETYHGGKKRHNCFLGRPNPRYDSKIPVVGAIERSKDGKIGRVIARVAPDTKKDTPHRFTKNYVLPSSQFSLTNTSVTTDSISKAIGLYTSAHSSQGARLCYGRRSHQYNRGILKRGISGVYHSVSAKYLQTYLNEHCFRYSRRDQGNLPFKRILEQVSTRAS